MYNMESNIANVTKANNLYKRTAQEQDKISLQSNSSEYQVDDLVEEVNPSSEELRLKDICKYISHRW